MRRLVLLVTCLAVGAGVGVAGFAWSGSEWWYAAVPAALAAGWLAVANPERCIPPDGRGQGQ